MAALRTIAVTIAIALTVALVAGCGGKSKPNLEPTALTTKGQLYAGMSSDAATRVMGPPDKVAEGSSNWKFKKQFQSASIKDDAVEWAWAQPTSITVMYLENGNAKLIGTIPKDL